MTIALAWQRVGVIRRRGNGLFSPQVFHSVASSSTFTTHSRKPSHSNNSWTPQSSTARSVPRPRASWDQEATCLVVTQDDEYLFDFLMEVVRKYSPNTTLRMSGGWVRDRLLGVTTSNHDIDILLDNVDGKQFSLLVQKYEIKQGRNRSPRHVLRPNPRRPDFVPVTVMKLFGYEVDFVNFRRPNRLFQRPESKSSSSSSSSSSSAAAAASKSAPWSLKNLVKQDAFQRDFTVNTLYYNLNEECIEDFTKSGLRDLKQRVLRTPHEDAKATLLYSPARALRAIRFACKYDFTIDPCLWEAVKNPEVHTALATTESRSRVGIEFEEILTSRDPVRGLRLLLESGHLRVVFRTLTHPDGTPTLLSSPWTKQQQEQVVARVHFLREFQQRNLKFHEAIAAIVSVFYPPAPSLQSLAIEPLPQPKARAPEQQQPQVDDDTFAKAVLGYRARVAAVIEYDDALSSFLKTEFGQVGRHHKGFDKTMVRILRAIHTFPGIDETQDDRELDLALWLHRTGNDVDLALSLLLYDASVARGDDPPRCDVIRSRQQQVMAYLDALTPIGKMRRNQQEQQEQQEQQQLQQESPALNLSDQHDNQEVADSSEN